MKQVVIENPVLNSPFREPARHFRFTDEGITNEVEEGRRKSSYFVPITRPKNKGKQQSLFETEWTQDRIEENRFVNEVRRHVSFWRNRKAIRRLLLYKESIVFATEGKIISYIKNV
jgi:type III restriction enzyme